METLEGKGRASGAAVEGRARRKQLCSYKHSIAALNDEEIVYFGKILLKHVLEQNLSLVQFVAIYALLGGPIRP